MQEDIQLKKQAEEQRLKEEEAAAKERAAEAQRVRFEESQRVKYEEAQRVVVESRQAEPKEKPAVPRERYIRSNRNVPDNDIPQVASWRKPSGPSEQLPKAAQSSQPHQPSNIYLPPVFRASDDPTSKQTMDEPIIRRSSKPTGTRHNALGPTEPIRRQRDPTTQENPPFIPNSDVSRKPPVPDSDGFIAVGGKQKSRGHGPTSTK